MRTTQVSKALAATRALTLLLGQGNNGMFASALQKKESELRKMMATPEVSYSRKHPSVDNSPRPPPKPFADFEKDRHNQPMSAQNQPPKPSPTIVVRDADEQRDHDERGVRQKLVWLEERTTTLENMVEDLTETITNPKDTGGKQTTTAALVSHLVRLSVVDRVLAADVALLAIARELGIVDVTAKLPAPAAPRAPASRMRVVDPEPEPEPEEDDDDDTAITKLAVQAEKKTPKKKKRQRAPYRSWAKAPERGPDDPPPGIVQVKTTSRAIPDAWHNRAEVAAKMTENGITQTMLAKASGIDQSQLSRYQRGAVGCPPDMVKRINAALDKLLK